MTRSMLLGAALAGLCVAGCAPAPPAAALTVPTEDMFLHATSARVVVFEEGTSCPDALTGLEAGDAEPLADSGLVEPCVFWDAEAFTFGASAEPRGLSLFDGEVTPGAVFVALLLDRDGTTVMAQGCRAGHAEQATVVVDLFPTRYYDDNYNVIPPGCASAADRCASADRDPVCE